MLSVTYHAIIRLVHSESRILRMGPLLRTTGPYNVRQIGEGDYGGCGNIARLIKSKSTERRRETSTNILHGPSSHNGQPVLYYRGHIPTMTH